MNLPSSEFEITRGAALLRGLEDEALQIVISAANLKNLDGGSFFFHEEEPAIHAFILLEGKVKLVQVTTDGQQVILGYLIPGRVYGIIAVLKKVTYPVSAQAVGKCKALVWDQETINHLMEKFPRMALNTLRIMSGQIRGFQNSVRDLSTKRVEQRVARAILRLARESGKKIDEGILIDLPLFAAGFSRNDGHHLIYRQPDAQGLGKTRFDQKPTSTGGDYFSSRSGQPRRRFTPGI